MKIELKRIEYSARMSEETSCFTADLWVDGVRIGQISNHGTGGSDDFYGDHAAYDAADAWCRANLPKWTMGDHTGETDIEIHVGALLEEHLSRKDMKRAMSRNVLFTKPDTAGVYEIKAKAPMKPTDPRLITHITTKYPGAVILNTLPEAEAFSIYASKARA